MAGRRITILCYWGGNMVQTAEGLSYDCEYKRLINVNRRTNYDQLLDRLYCITEVDRDQVRLKLTCRYPTIVGRDKVSYMSLHIIDDECLESMLDLIVDHPELSNVDLYLEMEHKCTGGDVHEIDATDTQLLTQDSDTPAINSPGIIRDTPAVNSPGIIHDSDTPAVDSPGVCEAFVPPGPSDLSVLHIQHAHRSTSIWNTQEERVLTCRKSDRTLHRIHRLNDQRVLHYLLQAGFYGLYCIKYIQLDWPLITALVERWRVETHTFHFPVGESTITLQDIGVLAGLPVDGEPVTGLDASRNTEEWQALCQELLGLTPPPNVIKGGRLHLKWLTSNFDVLPDDADDEAVRCHTRACILMMIGGHLLSDKSKSLVKLMFLPLLRDLEACGRLSWGAAGLACLYREMCRATSKEARDIGGPLWLLQLWAWERLAHIRPLRLSPLHQPPPVVAEMGKGHQDRVETVPAEDVPTPAGPYGCRWHVHLSRASSVSHSLRHYRDHLELMREEQMIWQPYSPDVLAQLPAYCLAGKDIWRTRAPLICFDVVELHLPDRVLRQFGLRQHVPRSCDTVKELHETDRRGRTNRDWKNVHSAYITQWRERHRHVVDDEPFDGRMDYSDPYMQWYRTITRPLILPPTSVPSVGFQPVAGIKTLLTQSLVRAYQMSINALGAYDADKGKQALQQIRDICRTTFAAIGEEHRLTEPLPPFTQGSASIPIQPTTQTCEAAVPRRRKRGTPKKAAPFTSAATEPTDNSTSVEPPRDLYTPQPSRVLIDINHCDSPPTSTAVETTHTPIGDERPWARTPIQDATSDRPVSQGSASIPIQPTTQTCEVAVPRRRKRGTPKTAAPFTSAATEPTDNSTSVEPPRVLYTPQPNRVLIDLSHCDSPPTSTAVESTHTPVGDDRPRARRPIQDATSDTVLALEAISPTGGQPDGAYGTITKEESFPDPLVVPPIDEGVPQLAHEPCTQPHLQEGQPKRRKKEEEASV